MQKKIIGLFIIMAIFIIFSGILSPEELPRPTYDNSLILSFTYPLNAAESSEVSYLKSQFDSGLYVKLTFSSFLTIDMDWFTNPANAENGIQYFKNTIDDLVQKAREYGVGFQIIIQLGYSRQVNVYKAAKEEDIRNAQWYNDNNLASLSQLSGTAQKTVDEKEKLFFIQHGNGVYPSVDSTQAVGINHYVFTTFSRYARKLRNHTEAKFQAAFNYLREKQEENPNVTIIVSVPGEAEQNSLRINGTPSLQNFFCDYSPYAILEFRDWIKHEGLYATGAKYENQGYKNGGIRYQGSNGLQNFNTDFGTTFTTWDLKYFHWQLSDTVDSNYTDYYNPDPNIIPFTNFTYDGMMPTSGSNYIAGGFDPPRTMSEEGVSPFNDLWQTFRQTMVYHFVKDMASIARQSGFSKEQYYTHQIPGEYLWGNNPDDPSSVPNARYYSSASPLWTAKPYNDIGTGVTAYDINFISHYSRTSLYLVPALSTMSSNWGLMEYNPEIIPSGNLNDINTVEAIYQQILRIYNYNVHFMNFFKWIGLTKYQIKGNNRETAVKQFFDLVKDKARQSIDTVFIPKQVENVSAQMDGTGAIDIRWGEEIWTDLPYKWEDWGDFKEFIIYKGYSENFQANSTSEIVRLTNYYYKDSSSNTDTVVFYKIAALNTAGKRGNLVTIAVNTGAGGSGILEVSRMQLNFAASTGGISTPSQSFFVYNTGSGLMNWSVDDNADWLNCTPNSGLNSGKVTVSIDAAGKVPGTYQATITITAQNAAGSPLSINVTLKVYAEGTDAPPFGTFETPTQNSTVRSSIPVTGWVVDDIGLESVKIYRLAGNKLQPVGDAVFVEGARPDIETTYPDYPNNHKAGWGYMMLTNFLPNQGNGTYTFHAVATDVSGHQVTLGTKTIICDNDHADRPFGALDTPTQGGEASGNAYINWGWALTPQPNSIPIDGSTINVYIDGIKLGHPVYNRFRSDIADFFPGYANSNGAAGYYYINTNNYSNGIHTISWSVRDSGGNVDGIGSRYFSIDNSSSTRNSARNYFKKNVSVNTARLHLIASHLTQNSQPVGIIKGYKQNNPANQIYPGQNGIINIKSKELERIVIFLKSNTAHTDALSGNNLFQGGWQGFQYHGDQIRPFPPGSTLDSRKGIFYWQPGLAYVGEYNFIFLREIKPKLFERKRITIRIEPKV